MRSDNDTTRHAWLYENIYKKCTSRCDITIFHVSTFLAKYFSTKIIIHKDSLYPDYSVVRNNQPYQSRRYLLRPIARFIAFLHSLSALFFPLFSNRTPEILNARWKRSCQRVDWMEIQADPGRPSLRGAYFFARLCRVRGEPWRGQLEACIYEPVSWESMTNFSPIMSANRFTSAL